MLEHQLLESVNPLGEKLEIEIRLGESAEQISSRLKEGGLITSAEGFNLYLIYSGLDRRIKPGKYHLSSSDNSVVIARSITDLTPEKVKFVILPGMRSEEIAALLTTSGLKFSVDPFLELVQNPSALLLDDRIKGIGNLEGFLFPGEYVFDRGISVQEFINTLVKACMQNVTSELIEGFRNNGLDLYQGVVLASLLQREGVIPEERAIIASVFYNRLAQEMYLQSDPTVQYAIGQDKDNLWKIHLSSDDIKFDSPYNTYLHYGLPPTPICNPDLSSIVAAAFPQKTDYLFFRSKCDNFGKHTFSKTYQEHLQNACK
jgi:UPF0755 protein